MTGPETAVPKQFYSEKTAAERPLVLVGEDLVRVQAQVAAVEALDQYLSEHDLGSKGLVIRVTISEYT